MYNNLPIIHLFLYYCSVLFIFYKFKIKLYGLGKKLLLISAI